MYRILARRAIVFIGIALAVFAALALKMWQQPPQYEAEASLLVRFGREYQYVSDVADPRGRTKFFTREDMINTEIEILTSRDVAERLIRQIGPALLYPDLAEGGVTNTEVMANLLEKFGKDLRVRGSDQSAVLRVSFRHPDPELAAKVVNQLVDCFKERHIAIFGESKTTAFLVEKSAEYRKRLSEAEEALDAYRQQYALFVPDEQRKLLLAQRMSIDGQLKSLANQAVDQQHSMFAPDEQRKLLLAQRIGIDGQLKNLANQAAEQQQRLTKSELESIQSKQAALVTQLAQMDEQLEKLTKSAQEALLSKKAELAEQLAQVDEQLRTLNTREKTLRNLQRDVATAEEMARTYARRLEDARISDEMDEQKMTNISSLQAATVPARPSGLPIMIKLALAAVAGLLAGFVGALLADFVVRSAPQKA